jgi:hypothetical protein
VLRLMGGEAASGGAQKGGALWAAQSTACKQFLTSTSASSFSRPRTLRQMIRPRCERASSVVGAAGARRVAAFAAPSANVMRLAQGEEAADGSGIAD